jgi:hypothetical protein
MCATHRNLMVFLITLINDGLFLSRDNAIRRWRIKKSFVALCLCAVVVGPVMSQAQSGNWQRILAWDYNVDPRGGPNPGGLPGVVYSGPDDPDLWSEDLVAFTGDTTWYAASALPFNDLEGAIGWLEPAPGVAARKDLIKKGQKQVTLNNKKVTGDGTSKRMYASLIIRWRGDSVDLAKMTAVVEVPGPNNTTITHNPTSVDDTSKGKVQWDNDRYGWQITRTWTFDFTPNPPKEVLYFNWDATPAGSSVLLRKLTTKSECVPEPASLAFVMLGGAAATRRRRS